MVPLIHLKISHLFHSTFSTETIGDIAFNEQYSPGCRIACVGTRNTTSAVVKTIIVGAHAPGCLSLRITLPSWHFLLGVAVNEAGPVVDAINSQADRGLLDSLRSNRKCRLDCQKSR